MNNAGVGVTTRSPDRLEPCTARGECRAGAGDGGELTAHHYPLGVCVRVFTSTTYRKDLTTGCFFNLAVDPISGSVGREVYFRRTKNLYNLNQTGCVNTQR